MNKRRMTALGRKLTFANGRFRPKAVIQQVIEKISLLRCSLRKCANGATRFPRSPCFRDDPRAIA